MRILVLITIASLCWCCNDPQPEEQGEVVAGLEEALDNDETVEAEEEPAFPQKVVFSSMDELPVHANLYHVDDQFPVIVMCHQARFNKMEYIKIAEKVAEMGFNCLAIDQRSGDHVLQWFNETLLEAQEDSLPTDFLDAEQDIRAAIQYASMRYRKPVILWGSSYSATLALNIAIENTDVSAVISFSPGNYFKEKFDLHEKLKNLNKPLWVTSSRKEEPELTKLISGMQTGENQIQFKPQSKGAHGSRALWVTDENNEEYWSSLTGFLAKLK